MSETITRPTRVCETEGCGCTLYVVRYHRFEDGAELTPAWECCNCLRVTRRQTRNRPTLRQRARKNWQVIRDEWTATDEALRGLVDSGAVKSGALLVHGSAFNYHMDKLMMVEKPSRFEVGYHTAGARKDLALAKAFVAAQEFAGIAWG